MHDLPLAGCLAVVAPETADILLLDVAQPREVHLACLTAERQGRRLAFVR